MEAFAFLTAILNKRLAEYIKHDIPVIIKNEKYVLQSLAEEYATIYAKYINSEYIKNDKFNINLLLNILQINYPYILKIN